MEDALTWFTKEIVQHAILHWAWLLVAALIAGGGVVLGALVFGRGYKKRAAKMEAEIAELKNRSIPSPPTVTVKVAPGATYYDIKASDGGTIAVHISGDGEVVFPQPVRLQVAFVAEGLGISDAVNVEKIEGDPPEG